MAKEKEELKAASSPPEFITQSFLTEVYPKLAEAFGEEAEQRAKTAEFKGYDSTGYGYQYIANRLNEILGPSHWIARDEIIHQEKGLNSRNKTEWDIAMKMVIQFGNWRLREDGTSYFEVLAERQCYGGHNSRSLADALKGAYTNTFKKTVALFGPGRQAYEGSIDDDLVDAEGNGTARVGGRDVTIGNGANQSANVHTQASNLATRQQNISDDAKILPSQKRAITHMLVLKSKYDIHAAMRRFGYETNEENLDKMLDNLTEVQARQIISEMNNFKG